MPLTTGTTIEREIRAILIRHLPVGLEGVGSAQATAVVTMLNRKSVNRQRATVDPPQRKGLIVLKETALRHASSVGTGPDGAEACGTCRSADGLNELWPCPVWISAELLGVVEPTGLVELGLSG